MKTTRAIMLSAALTTSARQGGGATAFVQGPLVSRRASGPSAFAGKAVSPASRASNSPAFAAANTRSNPMRMMFSNLFKKKEMNYGELDGAAAEAAKAALSGEVPSKSKAGEDIATFAGGCFWGLELAFQRVPGVVATSVGYTQGSYQQPSYSEVCSGASGHTEAVQVYYNPSKVSFEELLAVFFGRIDPTELNYQGGDEGPQYRTGVYFHTKEQEATARKVFAEEQKKIERPIVTECMESAVYWPAELYHQQYLSKGGRYGMKQSAEKGSTETIRCYG